MLVEIDKLTNELTELEKCKEEAESKLSEVKTTNQARIDELNSEITSINTSIVNFQVNLKLASDLATARAQLDRYTEDLSKFPNPADYHPIDELRSMLSSYDSEIFELTKLLTQYEYAQSQYNQLIESQGAIKSSESELKDITDKLPEYEKYSSLFTNTGVVVQSVFTEVANIMTSSKFTVRTVKFLKSGEPRIDFDVDYKVGSYSIPYDELSGGQKVLVDMFFITKLFELGTRAGVLILDESLKELSEDNLEVAARLLKESRINSILLSTHVSGFNYYDRKLNAVMEGNSTTYSMEGV